MQLQNKPHPRRPNSFINKNRLPKIHPHKSIKQEMQQFQAIHYVDSETIKMAKDKSHYQELDTKFIEDVTKIAKLEDTNILTLIENINQNTDISYKQCQEIHFKCDLHRMANILNSNTQIEFDKTDQAYRCQCGCRRSKGNQYSVTSNVKQFNPLGPGVMVFFFFQKGIAINVLIACLIFGIYTTIINLKQGTTPSSLDSACNGSSSCVFLNNASARNSTDKSYSNIEFILGIFLCIVWQITLRVISYIGIRKTEQLGKALKTSSDYAVKIRNLPNGEYNENDLIEYFQNLREKEQLHYQNKVVKKIPSPNYGIKSIQIIYNMQFSRKLITKIKEACGEVVKLIDSRDEQVFIETCNYQIYKQKKTAIIETYQILNNLRKKFLNDQKFRKKVASASCIIEFNNQQDRNLLLQKYGKDKISFLKQLEAKITKLFCPQTKNIVFHGKILVIEPAPEPSDILWLNCEKQSSTVRLFIIYTATLLIIAISFALLLGLQYLNYYLLMQQSNSFFTTVISLSKTIALQVINKLLWAVLLLLLDLEYNDTLTNKIASLMNKTLFATCVNTLILPIIVYVYMQNSLYGSTGLVGFIFNYHVTTITVGLALKLFNPISLIKRLLLAIKSTRYTILNILRKRYGKKQEELFEKRIYELYEGEYFDIAEAYIFVLTNILHATFYCHLLPPLLFFSFGQVFLYYWVNKIKIIRFFKIPELIDVTVFKTAIAQATLIPIIYGMGSIFISYLQNNQDSTYNFNLTYQLIAVGLGVIFFTNPADILIKVQSLIIQCFCDDPQTIIQSKCVANQFKNSENQNSKTNMGLIKNKLNLQTIPNVETNQKILPKDTAMTIQQSYYKNSNSLSLLGFQRVLKGRHDNQLVVDQLKQYCQKHVPKLDSIKQQQVLVAKLLQL